MPTGWRPADVSTKYPVYKIEDVYHFEKYKSQETKLLLVWSWVQLVILLLLVSYLFGNIVSIGMPAIFLYGAFIFLFVYAFTELMDGSKYTIFWDVLKNGVGIAIVFIYGDWFGANKISPIISYVLLEYFAVSTFIAIWILKYAVAKKIN
jgi:hypothetical protein